jgi:hypothetical protein
MSNQGLLVQIGDEFTAANTFGAHVVQRGDRFRKVRKFAQPGWSNSGMRVGLNHNPILQEAARSAAAVTIDATHRPLFSAIEAFAEGEDPEAGDRPLFATVRSAYERGWNEFLETLGELQIPKTSPVLVLTIGRFVPRAMPGKFDRDRAAKFLGDALDFAGELARKQGFTVVDLDPVIVDLAGDNEAWPLAKNKKQDQDEKLPMMAARRLDEDDEEETSSSKRKGAMVSDLAKYLVLDERANEAVAAEVAKALA